MNYMLITNDPALATHAELYGVGRIFVDLEILGKQKRQGHLDTLISSHNIQDVSNIKHTLTSAELLVRVNPLHVGTKKEVDQVIEAGADILMLPMFQNGKELDSFMSIVDGRLPVVPLFETIGAIQDVEVIVSRNDIDEVYIGLNDLHLDMGLAFLFEPLANGLLDELSATFHKAGVRFGFGGIARVGEGIIPGEMVLGEHIRLGSSNVILSRTFHRKSESVEDFTLNLDLKEELGKLVEAESVLINRTENATRNDYLRMQSVVNGYVHRNV